jgi:aminopeptidase S
VEPRLAVRFAFWGAEELGLIGSRAYADTRPVGDLVGYLNFDMLGSRERLRGVYEGPYAQRWLRYFRQRGLPAETIDIAGRSDHAPFQERGVRTGGLFAGGDACYHAACDRVASVDRRLFEELTRAAAFGVAAFAPTS